MKKKTNYIKYHRSRFGLTNHIDGDGDLDPNYALIRNRALTGHVTNGKFKTHFKKEFNWLIECANTKEKGHFANYASKCSICAGIFKDVYNGNYNIKEFYMDNVVTIVDQHPLYPLIMEKFNGREID